MQVQINKTGTILEVGELPQSAQDFVFNYGIRQILNDCHSSIKQSDFKSVDEFRAAVDNAVSKKLAALQAGEFTVRRSSAEPIDPVERMVAKVAKEELEAAIRAKGLKLRDVSAERKEALLASHIEKNNERLTREAKTRLKKSETVEINLDDLGF